MGRRVQNFEISMFSLHQDIYWTQQLGPSMLLLVKTTQLLEKDASKGSTLRRHVPVPLSVNAGVKNARIQGGHIISFTVGTKTRPKLSGGLVGRRSQNKSRFKSAT